MKILQINSVCGIRSTGRICTDLAEVLEQNGHECKIAYGRESVPEKYQKYAVRIGSDFDVKMHALQSRIFDNSGFGSKRATEKFIKWVKEYNPDIIHLHNIHGYYINIEILFRYLEKADKPVVWTLHDCWTFTGHCTYYSYVNCQKWKDGCNKCLQKNKYPISNFIDASQKNWQKKKSLFTCVKKLTLVTPSQWLATQVKQSFWGKYPIKVIPNGIDLTIFKQTLGDFKEKNGLVGRKIILGVASVWTPRKGLDDLVECSKLLSDDYRVVIVGLTEKQKKKIPDSILKISCTKDAKFLSEIYSAADVFVNPTYEDNYPTVNIEAQACGTPVITYKTGGSVESVPVENVIEQGSLNKCTHLFEKKLQILKSVEFDKWVLLKKYIEIYKNI